jgi:uncharacterized Tic20 family protein
LIILIIKPEMEMDDQQIYLKEERNMAMLAHLTVFAGFIIPFGNIIGPLLIWLLKREEMPFVDDQGKEALNFQISVLIYFLASAVFIVVLVGIVLIAAVGVFDVVCTIIAAVRASEGIKYRYPLCIRLIK